MIVMTTEPTAVQKTGHNQTREDTNKTSNGPSNGPLPTQSDHERAEEIKNVSFIYISI